MRVRFLLCLSLFAWLPMSSAGESVPEFRIAGEKPKLHSTAIKEASGLAVSSRDKNFLWIINDSGAAPEIHLANTDGTDRGKISLKRCRNVDWEDLAAFTLDGVPYLIAADIGDNGATRKSCTLHILREPALPRDGHSLNKTVGTAWTIRFRYEGGPRDCESIAVDVPNRKILLLSKRTRPPELHELPLRPKKAHAVITTRKIGQTTVAAPDPIRIAIRNQPTGMDISRNNSMATVITYAGVFLFPRSPAETWATAFARKPVALQAHQLTQAESIAFSKDGKTIFAISEGLHSPIVRYGSHPPANP